MKNEANLVGQALTELLEGRGIEITPREAGNAIVNEIRHGSGKETMRVVSILITSRSSKITEEFHERDGAEITPREVYDATLKVIQQRGRARKLSVAFLLRSPDLIERFQWNFSPLLKAYELARSGQPFTDSLL